MKIVVEYDPTDIQSCWEAAQRLMQARADVQADADRLFPAWLQATYFSGGTPIEWWCDLLDRLEVPLDASAGRVGKAIRGQGIKIHNEAVKFIVAARKPQ